MPTQFVPGEDDQSAVMATIGHVCIQWALLENNLLAILASAQNITIDEAAILFGGLDMKPRLNMAILLASHHKWHPRLQKRLDALRKAIDKMNLVNDRNMMIHGVHSTSPLPQHFNFYTPRRKGSAQHETWTILKAHRLGTDIASAANEAYSIFMDYGVWKFGEHRPENHSSQLVATQTTIITRIKQYLSTRINYIFGK